jgi:uncharacterized pyridoxamine 5'-phosphate oxidase family protein
VKFAKENPGVYIATVDNGQPRVRRFSLWFADETGFYFQTEACKDVFRQLEGNPRVEVCFHHPDSRGGTTMRVAGEVEFLEDIALKKRVLEDRKLLKGWGLTPDNPRLIIFRIAKGVAYFYSIETNSEPKKLIEFGKKQTSARAL